MRWAPAVVLAVGVILAGCSGLPVPWGGDEGSVETPTGASVPGDDSALEGPPGVLSLQVVNPSALGRAHGREIENRSYVLTSERTVRYENGTARSHLATRVALDENRTFLANVSTAGPEAPVFVGSPPAEAAYWSDGTTYLRRLTREGTTTYVEFEPPGTWVGTWSYWAKSVPFGGRDNRPASFYASLFSAVPMELTERTTLEGTTVFRIENHGDRPFSDDAFPGRVESIRDVRLVALVDGDGLVRSLDLQYVGRIDGEPVRVDRTVGYANVGSTSVGRPAWYDRAVTDSPDASESTRT